LVPSNRPIDVISDPTIGLAHAVDADAIARMSRDEIEVGFRWSWTPQRVLRAVRDRDTNALVARDGALVIGFALMRYDADRAHLLLLGVAPHRRRQGIGTALLAWHDRALRVAGIDAVQVELRASNNAARAFYERLGFELVNATPRYYRGIETALHMVKGLPPARPDGVDVSD
jgi:ribosomal-protein-alanine N-acetyltransferase